MLRVTVELLSARTGETSTLGVAYISNVTDMATHVASNGKVGNYHVQLSGRGGERHPTGQLKKVWRTARVENYPRLSLVVWHLIARALTAACAAPVPETSKRKRKAVQSAPQTQEGAQ